MRQNQRRGALRERRSEKRPDVEVRNGVLSANGHDVRTGHAVLTVDEEAGEVFAVGKSDELSEVTDPSMVRLIPESVGLPADAPHAARARDPTDLFAASGVD